LRLLHSVIFNAILYRVSSMLIQSALLWLLTAKVGYSLVIVFTTNAVCTVWYMIYHYFFYPKIKKKEEFE